MWCTLMQQQIKVCIKIIFDIIETHKRRLKCTYTYTKLCNMYRIGQMLHVKKIPHKFCLHLFAEYFGTQNKECILL